MRQTTRLALALVFFVHAMSACSAFGSRSGGTTTTSTTGSTSGGSSTSGDTTTGGTGSGATTGDGSSTTGGGTTGGGVIGGLTTCGDFATPFICVTHQNQKPQFALNGAVFNMVGYEASVANASNYCSWTESQLDNAFDEMKLHSSVNTVRMWFLQSAGGPGNWANFDDAVAKAKDHNFLIIPTLVNQWGDCEPPYSQDPNLKNYKTIGWYQSGYKTAGDQYPLSYRDFVSAVAARYSGESTIAFWQLVNEAEAREPHTNTCPDETASAMAIRAFADDMVSVIHAVDSNHLVNLGTQDDGYCGVGGSDYGYVYSGNVEICEVHTYQAVSPALPSKSADKISQCLALNKPVFMGEMGFCRNIAADGTCPDGVAADANSLSRRADFFDARFSAGFSAGLSGMLIWQWSPNGSDATYGVVDGDPVEAVMGRYR